MTPSIRRAALERWLSKASEVLEEQRVSEDDDSVKAHEGEETSSPPAGRWSGASPVDAILAVWPGSELPGSTFPTDDVA